MENQLGLSAEERQFALGFVAGHTGHTKRPDSLSSWLEMWVRFVTEVEVGYNWSIYEYAADLSVRDILQALMDTGPDSLRRKLEAWVQPWDERFLLATRPIENPLDPAEPPAALARISRIPNKMGEELETDLRNEGILD